MAFCAAAGAFEILLSGLCIAGLQILGSHAPAPAGMCLGRGLASVNERDQTANLRWREVEPRHLVVGPAFANNRGDVLAGLVRLDQLRLRQVRAGLAAHRIAAVTEGAVLVKQRPAGFSDIRRLTALLKR